MKNIMWKYFTGNSTQKYIDVLPSIVEKYNTYTMNTMSQSMLERLRHRNSMLVIKHVQQDRKVRLRKDLHPIGQKRCLPLSV